jgi:hypothetical protein
MNTARSIVTHESTKTNAGLRQRPLPWVLPDSHILAITHPFGALFIQCPAHGKECTAFLRIVSTCPPAESMAWN